MRKVIFIGLIIIALVFVTINIVLLFWGRDEPPPQDADLRFTITALPDSENAYVLFKQAVDKMQVPERPAVNIEDIIDGKTWDDEFVAELIAKNSESFNLLNEAVKSPHFQCPEALHLDFSRPKFTPWRNLAELYLIRTEYLFRQGKEKEALDDTLKIVQLGHLIEGSPYVVIEYSIGNTLKEYGLEYFRRLLKDSTLPPASLNTYRDELDRFKANAEGLILSFKWEYMFACKLLDDLASGKMSFDQFFSTESKKSNRKRSGRMFGYMFKPNKTKRMIAERFRVLTSNAQRTWADMSLPEEPHFVDHEGSFWTAVSENGLGKLVYCIAVPHFEVFLLRRCTEDFTVAATRLLIALKCYKSEKGGLPQSLNELVPEYISKVPEDPFDGQPMRYSAERKVIYSVGKDLKDTGGIITGKASESNEPVIKIEF